VHRGKSNPGEKRSGATARFANVGKRSGRRGRGFFWGSSWQAIGEGGQKGLQKVRLTHTLRWEKHRKNRYSKNA